MYIYAKNIWARLLHTVYWLVFFFSLYWIFSTSSNITVFLSTWSLSSIPFCRCPISIKFTSTETLWVFFFSIFSLLKYSLILNIFVFESLVTFFFVISFGWILWSEVLGQKIWMFLRLLIQIPFRKEISFQKDWPNMYFHCVRLPVYPKKLGIIPKIIFINFRSKDILI